MALIQCRECKKEISSTAKSCPHCGAAVKTSGGGFGSTLAVVVVLFVLFAIVGAAIDSPGSKRKPTPKAPEIEASVRKSMIALKVTNTGHEDWTELKVYVNPSGLGLGYQGTFGRVPAGQWIEINLIELTTNDGERFQPLQRDVRTVLLRVPGFEATTYGFN